MRYLARMTAWVVALAAGVLVALLVSPGRPASAANQQIAAQAANAWSPKDVTVSVGELVTWSNTSGVGFHNVCVARPGKDPIDGCGEFRNGDPATDWSTSHTFFAPGKYRFHCQAHGAAMGGTVTVEAAPSSGTGTGTATGPTGL